MPHFSDESKRNVLALMRRLRAMDDADYLRHLIAYHAAPTVRGLKPASLICPGAATRDLEGALSECGQDLEETLGVRAAPLRNRSGALLLLVYCPRLLGDALAVREVRELLLEAGYEAPADRVEALIAHLGRKCADASFPHEIGVFLGYPVGDVRRFMREGGRGCRNAGCWKAYGDVSVACTRSDGFRRAKLLAAEMIVGGASLGKVAVRLREAV